MDIKIEVVGKEEKLEFPYVVKTAMDSMVLMLNDKNAIVIEVNNYISAYKLHQVLKTKDISVEKRYKIIDFNLKLKEV